jgi:hypothetical protein
MYAKLFTSIYQGTLRGDSHGLLVFTNLIAHADSAGHVDIHPRAIADEVGLTLEQVKEALLKLEAPDSESRSPELDGRRIVRLNDHRDWGWVVVNYIKYRAIRDEEDRREQNRLAQQRWRERQKGVLTVGEVSSVSQDKPIQKQKQKKNNPPTPRKRGSDEPEGFAEFWKSYPRKTAKAAAMRAYAKLEPDEALRALLSAAIRRQAAGEQWRRDGGQFIPHPASWLNGRRWEDQEPEVPKPVVGIEVERIREHQAKAETPEQRAAAQEALRRAREAVRVAR